MSYYGWRYSSYYKTPAVVLCNGIRVNRVWECATGPDGWVRYIPSTYSFDDVVDGVYGEMFGNVEVVYQ